MLLNDFGYPAYRCTYQEPQDMFYALNSNTWCFEQMVYSYQGTINIIVFYNQSVFSACGAICVA